MKHLAIYLMLISISGCLVVLAMTGCGPDTDTTDTNTVSTAATKHLASDYGVTDPQSAALVIIDQSDPYYIKAVALMPPQTSGRHYNSTEATQLGAVTQGGQAVFAISPGTYELCVECNPNDVGGNYILINDIVYYDLEIGAGEAKVLAAQGGTWSGNSGHLPSLVSQ
jgi:hypothetical protein